jgi:hypothetical protein
MWGCGMRDVSLWFVIVGTQKRKSSEKRREKRKDETKKKKVRKVRKMEKVVTYFFIALA